MDFRARCPNCGSDVAPLAYCGVCGKPLSEPLPEADQSPRGRLMAALASVRSRPVTSIVVIVVVVMFLLLLADRAGLATLVALLIVPGLLIHYLTRLDLYEREPWSLMAGVVAAGALLGLLGGWSASVIVERFWFTDTRLNLGAVGFAGVSANGRDGVPFVVLLLNGLLVPALAGAAVMGGPILLRRWPAFRNEVSDGMTLGGLAASGFVTITAFVYFWPSVFDDLPDRPVSQWTALLVGTVVIRPIVFILAGSLLGIAAWQYVATKDIRGVLLVAVGGVFGWMALPIGSLVLAQSGAVAELIWYVIVLIVVGVLFRETLTKGLARDRAVLSSADGQQRIVCPTCRRVTPDGSFCSFCRSPLHQPVPVALGTTNRIPDDRTPDDAFDDQPASGRVVPGTGPVDRFDGAASAFEQPGTSDGPDHGVAERRSEDLDSSGGAKETSAAWPTGFGAAAPAEIANDDWSRSTAAPFENPVEGDDQWKHPEDAGSPEAARDEPDEPTEDRDRWQAETEAAPADDYVDTSAGPARAGDWTGEPSLDTASRSERPGPLPSMDARGLDAVDDAPDFEPHEPGPDRPSGTNGLPQASGESGSSGTDDRPEAADDPDDAETTEAPVVSVVPPSRASRTEEPAEDDQSAVDAERRGPSDLTEMVDSGAHWGDTPTNPTEGPLVSSSGRWFDASSGQPTERGSAASGPVSDAGSASVPSTEAGEPQPLFPAASPPRIDPPPGDALTQSDPEADPPVVRATPLGLRWYRTKDEASSSSPESVGENVRAGPGGSTVESDGSAGSESVEPPDAIDSTERTGGQSGIWRQLSRGVRTSGPRAPQRDQERRDACPGAASGSDRSET